MIKRIIFDIDGTLVDEDYYEERIRNVLKRIGLDSDKYIDKYLYASDTYEDHYSSYNSTDYTTYFSKIMGVKLDEDSFISTIFDEVQYCIPKDNTKLRETLNTLSSKYELVILSNYFEKGQIMRLKNMGIDKYFSGYYGERIIKDNKEAYMDACGNCKPSECVMIGDNLKKDIIGAKRYGLHTIFVTSLPNDEYNTIDLVKNLTVEYIDKLDEEV